MHEIYDLNSEMLEHLESQMNDLVEARVTTRTNTRKSFNFIEKTRPSLGTIT